MSIHKHHIIPRFLGGKDMDNNIEHITAEQHYQRHYDAWTETGDIRHLHSAKLLQKNHLSLTDEEQRVVCSAAGKISGRMQYEKGLNIHSQTPEERKIIASLGGKNGEFQVECIMRGGLSRKDAIKELSKRQSSRGKRGGVKNRGFVWINNGVIDVKYTISMQNDKSVDEYIKENPSFMFGRLNTGDVICPHCGKVGKSYPAMCRYHFDRCKHKE